MDEMGGRRGIPAESKRKGIACLIFSAFSFALMGMFVHLADLYGGEINVVQKSFFRNIIAFLIAGSFFFRHKGPVRFPVKGIPLLFARAIFGTLGIFGNFYALGHIPIGNAAMLNKLSPFFAIVFSWILVGEKMTPKQTLAVVGAFIGSLFVVKPTPAITDILPELAGLGSGISAGVAYACVRKLGIMKMDPRIIILFFSGFSSLIAVPFMVASFDPMTATQVLILFGAGAAAAGGQFGITAAYRLAPPKEIAVYDYTNILFAALLGFFIFDQKADLYSWIGFAIILAMALLMYGRTKK